MAPSRKKKNRPEWGRIFHGINSATGDGNTSRGNSAFEEMVSMASDGSVPGLTHGANLLHHPRLNKSTAFTEAER